MMKNYLFAILCVFLSACGGTQTKNKKVSVQSLEAKQASGVVLIKIHIIIVLILIQILPFILQV